MCSFLVSGQLSDLAKLDYTLLPSGGNKTEYSRVRALFNYPIKLNTKNSSYLIVGLDYSKIGTVFTEETTFDYSSLEDFQLLDLNIGYTTKLKNNWRIGVRMTPGISTNASINDWRSSTINLSGMLVFLKEKKEVVKPWKLILGVSYSANRGFPFPLPFISYNKKFHPNWAYNIGVPKSNLQYHFNDRHKLKLYAELDGFTGNLSEGLLLENNNVAHSVNISLIVGGLHYEYYITKRLQLYARTAYILRNNTSLRDRDRERIQELDTNNLLYLRTGIRLKI
ncbi:DUF6268 family outer membrane beta-barrel protein [Aquimarina latercula]|uniref:DUF6268 family outer membrane beta-barrel protein n=1 Tax=Aquimarina latercula TaxID=987 RepID=UPI0012DE914D|nr:DUF6268 family outer membrane beta-barrel protein [Aquimarina latercula]